jgi:selenocysteine lyase/cysteine desulfurase
VSFTVADYHPADVAALLEQIAGVESRAGFHCAALVHRHLGTADGGTVRVSFGPFNGPGDVAAVVGAVAAVVGAAGDGHDDGITRTRPAWQT